jgi:hypothetical protein
MATPAARATRPAPFSRGAIFPPYRIFPHPNIGRLERVSTLTAPPLPPFRPPMKTAPIPLLVLAILCSALPAPAADPSVQPIYKNDFESAEVDTMPKEMLVIGGAFAVKQDKDGKYLELPGEPLDTFGLPFRPERARGRERQRAIFRNEEGPQVSDIRSEPEWSRRLPAAGQPGEAGAGTDQRATNPGSMCPTRGLRTRGPPCASRCARPAVPGSSRAKPGQPARPNRKNG